MNISILLLTLLGVACANSSPRTDHSLPPNEVIVMGAIHGDHTESSVYGIPRIEEILRKVQPDYILAEIPPDSLAQALAEFRATDTIEKGRVSHFPEYVLAVFPLQKELGYEIVACAGWTADMALKRCTLLADWKQSRPDETRQVDAAMTAAEAKIVLGHKADDPLWIHSPEYDAIVKEGMGPYSGLFGADLGAGGWPAINASHYALIEKGIAEKGQGGGKRFLVIFGARHKYWFLEKLAERPDLRVGSLRAYL